MATTATLTGTFTLPNDAAPDSAVLSVTLSAMDTDQNTGHVLPDDGSFTIALVAGAIPAGQEIWKNTAGLRGTHYRATLAWAASDGRLLSRYLGSFQVGDDASYDMADLLDQPPIASLPEGWYSTLTQGDYDAAITARDEAVAAAAAAEADAVATAADRAAIEAQAESYVTLTGTQTLTNKTVIGAILSGTARANSLTDAGRLVFVGDLGAVPGYDDFAAFDAANLPEPVNTAIVEGRVWVADADGPITADNGRIWRPAGVVTPGDFGAPGNNVALDTPALLEWADYVARVAKVGYVDKIYRCSAELDFTQGGTVAANDITIYGDSDEGCEIQWQRMGCEKFWMKFNWLGSTANSTDVILRNWTARGFNTTLTKDTSCGVMAINNQRWKIENFRVQYHGSCGIYATRSFNSDLLNVKITEGGTQYLERTDLLAVDIVDGDVNFSVADGSLSAADVGRVVAIDDAVEAYPQLSAGYMANRIASVLSSTTGTFETAPTATNTDCAMVFGRVRFSATNGSDVVTLSSDCLDADDLGRFVWLPNAGSQGHTLHSVIVEIIAADQCRLGVAASRTTEGDFTTSVALHVGNQPDEYTSQPSPYVNDMEVSAVQIEDYNGAAIYVARGDHVYFSQLKTHGRTFNEGVNLSGPAFINDARNVTVHQWHCELNGCSPDEAVIVCCGPLYGITFTDTTVAGNPNNSWFAQHCEAVSTTQFINLNGLQSRIRWDKMKGIFKRQAGQFNGTSGNLWDIDADGGNAFGTFVAPRQYGDMRLWAESSKLRVLDADPAAADSGSMMFHQGNVLGPVSQSSGVPTGAIIERDATGDGAYIKFADGTLICWHTQTVNLTIATGLHGGFRSGGQVWNYPAEFASATVVVTATVRSITAFGANAYPDSTTRCFWHVTAVTTQAAADRTVSLMAIGRWF